MNTRYTIARTVYRRGTACCVLPLASRWWLSSRIVTQSEVESCAPWFVNRSTFFVHRNDLRYNPTHCANQESERETHTHTHTHTIADHGCLAATLPQESRDLWWSLLGKCRRTECLSRHSSNSTIVSSRRSISTPTQHNSHQQQYGRKYGESLFTILIWWCWWWYHLQQH